MKLIGYIALIPLVLGTAVGVSATERVDASLVASGFLNWLFLPLLQVLTGLALVRGSAVGVRRSLEAYFETHWPWSLWFVAAAILFHAFPFLRDYTWWIIATALVPAVVTVRLLSAVCRTTLRMPLEVVRRRLALHQAITWALVFSAFTLAVDLWPRVVSLFS